MRTIAINIFIFLCYFSQYAQDPGDMYTGFSEDGIYTENWEDTISHAYAIGVLTDGSFIAAGNYELSFTEGVSYALKMDVAGNLMPFGNFSRGFEADFTEDEDETILDLMVLPDDKILIAGHFYSEPDYHPFVIRLLSNGTPDENFGEHGIFTDESIAMEVSAMEIYQTESSYKIILGGYSCPLGNPQLLMIDDEGIIDPAFGSGGIILFMGSLGLFNSLEIDNKNSFLYASGKTFPVYGTIISKYNLPDGAMVTDFGDEGFLIYTELEGFDGAVSASVLDTTDNTLAVFGDYRYSAGDYDIFAYRMNAFDGTPDETFGIDGWSSLRSAESSEHIFSAILQSDGKYYYGGCSDINGSRDFLLGRLNHNGFADNSFGTNGFVLTDVVCHENLMSFAFSPAENILYAAGYYYCDLVYDEAIVVAAYHTGFEVVPPVGITSNESPAIECYPNPSSGTVNIETGLDGFHLVQIIDLAGKELINKNFSHGSIELNLEMLQPSVYFIKVTMPDMQVVTSKLIVQ